MTKGCLDVADKVSHWHLDICGENKIAAIKQRVNEAHLKETHVNMCVYICSVCVWGGHTQNQTSLISREETLKDEVRKIQTIL